MRRHQWIRWLTLSILSVALSGALSSCTLLEILLVDPIRATLDEACATAPFEVTKTEDTYDALCTSDDCSLREAVFTANACEGHQEIQLSAETYPLTLTDPRRYTDPNASRRLVVTEDVTITGNGAVVDAGGTFQILEVRAGSEGAVDLTDITLRGGRGLRPGGALYVDSGDVTLTAVVIRDNEAGSITAGAPGGGVFVGRLGSLTLVDTHITGNTANGEGGGIYFAGDETMLSIDADSVVSLNRSLENYGGGGIYSLGEATIAGRVENNTSSWTGGGIFNAGDMQLEAAVVAGNSASTGGGGIANTGVLHISEGQVTNNDAADGGGLFTYDFSGDTYRPMVNLVGSEIADNTARQAGGGIFNSTGVNLTATSLNLRSNRAARGGGIFNVGTANLLQSSIRRNTVSSPEGGGLWNSGNLSLVRSTVSGNRASGGSGGVAGGSAAWAAGGGALGVLNSTVSGNEIAGGDGAAVFNYGGVIEAKHVTIAENDSYAFGGLSGSMPSIRLRASIIVADGPSDACTGTVTSEGFNVFKGEGCAPDPTLNDLLLGGGEDPGITSLSDHGGPTQTHALTAASPALDAVTEGCPSPAIDQRGVDRPAGDACDSGAFEATGDERRAGAAGGTPTSGELVINFNADLYTIERGECTTLRWQVTGADMVSLFGNEVEHTDAQEVCPGEDTGYTLVGANESEEASEYLEIEVTEPTDDLGCIPDPESNKPCP